MTVRFRGLNGSNLEAAAGDLSMRRGDKKAACDWYEKALTTQKQLIDRRPWDEERNDELQQIKKHLEELAQ